MIAFELINPSDEIWLKANDARAAIAAALLVGDGFYGLKCERGETVMGVIAFGNADEFLEEKFGSPDGYPKFLAENLSEVALVLDSFETKRARGSMTDIVGKAHWTAGVIRERAKAIAAELGGLPAGRPS